jgi:hypothetical protein
MTGRGFGRCGGYARSWRGGFGRGRRWFFNDHPDDIPPTPPNIRPYYEKQSPEEEKNYLEGVVKDMEAELLEIKKRIEELDKEKSD